MRDEKDRGAEAQISLLRRRVKYKSLWKKSVESVLIAQKIQQKSTNGARIEYFASKSNACGQYNL